MWYCSYNCFAGTDEGDVYTWGWKECVPTGRVIGDQSSVGAMEKDERQMAMATDQGGSAYFLPSSDSRLKYISFSTPIVYRYNKGNSITVSPRSQVSRTSSGAASGPSESRGTDDSTKRRRLSSAKHGPESSTSSDESLSAPPCVVTFNTGVKIVAVAAGGRHTLALSGNLHLSL